MQQKKYGNNNKSNYFSRFGDEFQSRLFVALLNDRLFFERIIDLLKPQYFDNEIYKWLSEKITKIYTEKKIIPSYNDIEIYLSDEERNDVLYHSIKTELENLRKLQLNVDLRIVKEKAVEFCKNQEVKNAILKSVDLLQREEFEQIRTIINNAVQAGSERNIGHIYFDDFLYRVNNFRENFVSTGWELIDRLTEGGLAAGELGIILAGPGIGKTTTACNLSCNGLRKGKTVLYYTLEISSSMIGLKHDANLSDVPINDIKNEKEKVLQSIENIRNIGGKLIIKSYPTKTPTILNIRTHIQQVINQGYIPDLIIIDYADLLRSEKKINEKRFELEDTYEKMRELAGELKCVLWSCSQVNRLNADEEIITMSGFAEAFAKGHVSDFVMSLSRNMRNETFGNSNSKGTVFIAKNRIGPAGGVFTANIDMSRAKIDIIDYESTQSGNSSKSFKKVVNGYHKTYFDEDNDEQVRNQLSEHFKKFKNGVEIRKV